MAKGANAAVLGALSVIIGGDTGPLNNALNAVDGRLSGTEKRMKDVLDASQAMIGVMTAAAAAIAVVTKMAINNADAMYKSAQSAGLNTREFSELVYVAKLANVEAEALSSSINKMNRNLVEAAQGQGDAKHALDALGISIRDANGQLKSAEQIMNEVADRFSQFADGPEKSALAMAIFGKQGAALVPMLNQGSSAIKAMREEARQLGVTIDTETGKAAEDFNDNLTRLGQVQKGLANTLMRELLPSLQTVAQQLVDGAKAGQSIHENVKGFADFLKSSGLVIFQTLAVLGANVAFVFKATGTELAVMFAQLQAIGRLDFAGFKAMREAWLEESKKMRADLDDFEKRIMNIGQVTPEKPRASQADVRAVDNALEPKKRAPTPVDPKELEKRKAELKKLQDEDAKNWVDYVERVLKTLQEADEKAIEILQKSDEQFKDLFERRFLTDEQKEEKRFESDMEILRKRLELKLITQEEFDNLAEQLAAQHQARLTDIEKRGWDARTRFANMSMKDQAKTIFGELASITAGVAQHNRTMFELNKVAGIANAIISAYEGITRTMAAYPYPLNIAMAAAHGVAAFAQVNAIRSQQFGGGGGAAPSLAGGTPATPVTPVSSGAPGSAGGGNTTIVELEEGRWYSDKMVRTLASKLNETMADGGQILVRNRRGFA